MYTEDMQPRFSDKQLIETFSPGLVTEPKGVHIPRSPWRVCSLHIDRGSRSNKSILKEINPGCSLEGLMLKLKLQYFSHLMQTADSLEKTLMLGGIWGRRRRG